MANKIFKNKLWLVTVFCLICTLSCSDAFAWGGRHGGGERYHYRDGRWYRPGWFGFEFAVAALTIGAIVETIPRGYRTVVVAGEPYYYYDDVYYRPCPSGYVVVPAPVVTPAVVAAPPAVVAAPNAQPQVSSGETPVVNVPNSTGGYTEVKLIKTNNGYIGPQGEFYPGNPTVDKLKVLYGK